ncbi:MAG: GNAT family N-acetyltransferase [Haloechinothrix sp.]
MTNLVATQADLFAALDPLLPPVSQLPAGEVIIASLRDGRQVHGSVYRAVHGPDSVESLWQPRVVWEFTPLLGDTGRAGMDAALAAFRSWIDREVPSSEVTDPDTAAQVRWPSRDVAVAPALRAHGFVPMTTFAVRERQSGTTAARTDVVVRRATTADLDDLVALELAELRYSVDVIGGTARENAEHLLFRPLQRALMFGGRVLVAELAGVAVGVASCGWSSPVPGSSIEGLLPDGRWGYVGTLSVTPAARGSGIGRALMAEAHRELTVDGVRGTYLYYDIANPLSSVFWPRQGYRPLWTKWTAKPAATFR